MFAARKTDGAATATAANYIEDVFSTYLYTGNGVVQTIPNGIAIGDDYGGSVFFDGTGDNLSVADNTAFTLPANFTIECWIYPTAGAADRLIISKWGGTAEYYIFTQANNVIGFAWGPFSASGLFGGALLLSGNNAFALNTWSHVAVVRNSNTFTLYVNGTSVATATNSAAVTDGAEPVTIGDYGGGGFGFAGYISNARIVKGTAVYTANFTPSATPLTAISGTSLLTCQTPNTVLDYSSNAFTITVTNAIAQNGGGPFTDSTANKGGMVWLKSRSAATDHALYDTNRGATFDIGSNLSTAQTTQTTGLTSFNSNGFSIGSLAKLNTNAATYTSWTFRKQAKFFDVVIWTGNGTGNRTIPHSLGSTPGFIQTKDRDGTQPWWNHHRSVTSPNANWWRNYGQLNSTAAFADWGDDSGLYQSPDATNLYIGSYYNASGKTYVAYLFAHDAGGFGAAGTDNVISCGSYTGNASTAGPVVTLGYEPQWVLIKGTTAATQQWFIFDTMRGIVTESAISVGEDPYLLANTSAAETSSGISWLSVTSTGFQITSGNSNLNGNGENYIYIAIRRGPMKTPTSGTSVYNAVTWTGNNTTGRTLVHGLSSPPDLSITQWRSGDQENLVWDKLRGFSTIAAGNSVYLRTPTTGLDGPIANYYYIPDMVNVAFGSVAAGVIQLNSSSSTLVGWNFRRAPGFFDVVCYTGTGSNTTFTHNLSVVPEMMIVKRRDAAGGWRVYVTAVGNTGGLRLNTTDSTITSSTFWNNTTPTASVFTVGTNADVNASSGTYVAYLFATVAGVSKVGSYTGNGSSQTINCGFAAGARFILIKRTDSTGDWYVWDTARGIVAGNDPRLSLNSTAAEVTTDDSIDPDNSGFIVNQLAATNINVNAATYIYLAIA